jgi:hypothetical protein
LRSDARATLGSGRMATAHTVTIYQHKGYAEDVYDPFIIEEGTFLVGCSCGWYSGHAKPTKTRQRQREVTQGMCRRKSRDSLANLQPTKRHKNLGWAQCWRIAPESMADFRPWQATTT